MNSPDVAKARDKYGRKSRSTNISSDSSNESDTNNLGSTNQDE